HPPRHSLPTRRSSDLRAANAPIAGYPVAYFIQQMADFKNGNRKSSDPKKANTNAMIAIAKAMTDDEIKAAAEYFGSMKWTPWIRSEEHTSELQSLAYL